jgi:hypothetical protein
LIRPVSEQWGFSTAYVSAFEPLNGRAVRHLHLFPFGRWQWSFKRQAAKVYNTESGRKPGS